MRHCDLYPQFGIHIIFFLFMYIVTRPFALEASFLHEDVSIKLLTSVYTCLKRSGSSEEIFSSQ